jgi:hypothetical protein
LTSFNKYAKLGQQISPKINNFHQCSMTNKVLAALKKRLTNGRKLALSLAVEAIILAVSPPRPAHFFNSNHPAAAIKNISSPEFQLFFSAHIPPIMKTALTLTSLRSGLWERGLRAFSPFPF